MNNIKIWRVRKQAVELIRSGWSHRKVSRYLGYNPSTISRWYRKWFWKGKEGFYNLSCKPKRAHPKTTLWEHQLLVRKLRKETGMCHQRLSLLIKRKYQIDLKPFTIYRILKRNELIKSKKRYQRKTRQIKFFYPDNAGELIQLDTKYLIRGKRYQYTFIDVTTRYPVCIVTSRINQLTTIEVTKEALKQFPFKIKLIQTDNGQEFQSLFVNYLKDNLNIKHRYIRVRTPRHNGFVERMHRTVDEEFWQKTDKQLSDKTLNQKLKIYIQYYLTERVHLGLNGMTPMEKLKMMQRY